MILLVISAINIICCNALESWISVHMQPHLRIFALVATSEVIASNQVVCSSLRSVQNGSSQVNNFDEDISKFLSNKGNEKNLGKNFDIIIFK